MTLSKQTNILIVGLGLLGGSYAKALKLQGYRVSALTKSQSDIDYALAQGILDSGASEVTQAVVERADVIVFALYPTVLLEWIATYGHLIRPGAVVTDVTGVKSQIVYTVQAQLPAGVEFIAAHPMAGREVSGVENSDEKLFIGANYIVVPTQANTPEGIALCRRLGEVLGFGRITELSPAAHDEMIAFVSQLTHCLAMTLMCCHDGEGLEDYTGDSFRDLTRIAKMNDEMWSQLFLLNRDALLTQMERFRTQFDTVMDTLRNGDRDGLRAMMKQSTKRRSNFDKRS